MEKEHWKNSILRSLEGAKRAEPSPQLFSRIQAQLGAGEMKIVRRPYLALAAASLALLVSANVYFLMQQNTNSQKPTSTVYQLDKANFDFY